MDKTLDACLSLRMDTCRKLHAFECKSELPTLGRTIATITASVTIRLQTAPELPSYSSAKKLLSRRLGTRQAATAAL